MEHVDGAIDRLFKGDFQYVHYDSHSLLLTFLTDGYFVLVFVFP